jgi:hypothetical protein
MKRAATRDLDAALAEAERAAKRARVTPAPARQFEDVADIPELLTKIFLTADEPLPVLIANYTQADPALTRTVRGIQRVNYLWYAVCLHLFRRPLHGPSGQLPFMPPLVVCARWLRRLLPVTRAEGGQDNMATLSPFRFPVFVNALERVDALVADAAGARRRAVRIDATMSVRQMADALDAALQAREDSSLSAAREALTQLLLFRSIWQSIYTACAAAVTAAHGFYHTVRHLDADDGMMSFAFDLVQPTLDTRVNDAIAEVVAAGRQQSFEKALAATQRLKEDTVGRWIRVVGIGPTNGRILGTALAAVPRVYGDDDRWVQATPVGRIKRDGEHVDVGLADMQRLGARLDEPVYYIPRVNEKALVRVHFNAKDWSHPVPIGYAGALDHIIAAGQGGVAVDLDGGLVRLRIRASQKARDAAKLPRTPESPELDLKMHFDHGGDAPNLRLWKLVVVTDALYESMQEWAPLEYLVEYLDIWRAVELCLRHSSVDFGRDWSKDLEVVNRYEATPMRARFVSHIVPALFGLFARLRRDPHLRPGDEGYPEDMDARRYALLFSDDMAYMPDDVTFDEYARVLDTWLLPPTLTDTPFSPVLFADERKRSATMFQHPPPSDGPTH